MGRIIAVANQKGGVGKTTTAVNTAAALAAAGQRVLLCDFDPQGNATSGLGVDKNAVTLSVYDGLVRGIPARNIILRTRFCDVLPASIALAGAEIELVELADREHALKRLLIPVSFDYDYILIDTPPAYMMSDSKIVAQYADAVLMVVCQNSVPTVLINRTIDHYLMQDTPVMGCVLNRTMPVRISGRKLYRGKGGVEHAES